MVDFPKKYPSKHEKGVYKHWEEKKFFSRGDKKRVPKGSLMFASLPLSIAGSLHMGYAFSLVLQDILARFWRMQGKGVEWVPVFQHSSFLMHVFLEQEALDVGKKDMYFSSEEFFAQATQISAKKKALHRNFFKQLGISYDWNQEQFSFAEEYMQFVRKIFGELFEKWIIYQDKAMAHWNNKYQTVVGDTDIKFETERKKKYRVRYFVDTKKDSLVVATLRPDTIFADVALAVNPLDKRYRKLVGKKMIIPIINKAIPLIADERVDMTLDDGVVRITPGHDDFGLTLAKEYNFPLDCYAIDREGCFTEWAGIFSGKKVDDFFDNVVQYLDDISNLDASMDCEMKVPYCKKTGVKLEPLLMEQWFIRISEATRDRFADALASDQLLLSPESFKAEFESLLESSSSWCISRQYQGGQPFPIWKDKTQNHYILNEDLLISAYKKHGKKSQSIVLSMIIFVLLMDGRLSNPFGIEQLIDVLFSLSLSDPERSTFAVYVDLYKSYFVIKKWYAKDLETIVALTKEQSTKVVEKLVDVLEKTFLLTPHAKTYSFALHDLVGEKTPLCASEATFDSSFACMCYFLRLRDLQEEKFKKFVMASQLMTWYDNKLMTFRTLLFSEEYLKTPLVKQVFFHGLLVDKYSQKLGDSDQYMIDPWILLKEYSADALRLSLVVGKHVRHDRIYDSQNLLQYQKLVNKLRNASRYIILQIMGVKPGKRKDVDLTTIQKWLQSKISKAWVFDLWILYVLQDLLEEAQEEVTEYNFAEYGKKLVKLIQEDFCGWYLEITKSQTSEITGKVLSYGMWVVLKLLYPYMPFATEQLWQLAWFKGSLAQQVLDGFVELPGKHYKIHLFMDIVRTLLTLKQSQGSKQHEKVDLFVQATPDFLDHVRWYETVLTSLIQTNEIYYLRPHEDIPAGFAVDQVIDIKVGAKVLASKSKKEKLMDLQVQVENQKEYIQYLRTLISSASMQENEVMVKEKEEEMKCAKDDVERLEYEVRKAKAG